MRYRRAPTTEEECSDVRAETPTVGCPARWRSSRPTPASDSSPRDSPSRAVCSLSLPCASSRSSASSAALCDRSRELSQAARAATRAWRATGGRTSGVVFLSGEMRRVYSHAKRRARRREDAMRWHARSESPVAGPETGWSPVVRCGPLWSAWSAVVPVVRHGPPWSGLCRVRAVIVIRAR